MNLLAISSEAQHVWPVNRYDRFRAKLQPGQTYRRADLAKWSLAVDRHIKTAMMDGALTKLSGGLYYAPKKTVFGTAPPEDKTLVSTFLKGGQFLLASPNTYNALGVGATQLQNRTVVYNHKRHGNFVLGRRTYEFRVKPSFPKKLSLEFLLVDLVNNLDQLGESSEEVLDRVRARLATSDKARVKKAVQSYGSERAKKFFARALDDVGAQGAA
jgi:hypothetical protein